MASPERGARHGLTNIIPAALIVILQAFTGMFFVIDALSDDRGSGGTDNENLLEMAVAMALLAGTILSAIYVLHLVREIRLRSTAVAIASGALSTIIRDRFSQWGLSAAEADVALFALKGFSISEIAELRSAAPGTVRAQLSQVYSKAGVTSQPMLMSLFLEDLMDGTSLHT